jgi:hypothetical protein
MAAPMPSNRAVPLGARLGDGYQSFLVFAANTAFAIWERSVKPPGYDGGDAVETTTMHNLSWRTFHPRHLVTLTESTIEGGYDPLVYGHVASLVDVPTTITVWFPNFDSLCFYGFLRTFDPSALTDGEFPMATVGITPTNWDPILCVEAGPVYTPYNGTIC